MWLKRLGETLLADSDDEDDSGRESSQSDGLGFSDFLGTAKRFVDSANDMVLGGTFKELLAPDTEPVQRPVAICVAGSEHDDDCAFYTQLGRWVALVGANLLTGAGPGAAAHVAKAFVHTPDRTGSSIGVVPSDASCEQPKGGHPNDFVEIPIYTHLPKSGPGPQSRDNILVLSSDAIVAAVRSGEQVTLQTASLLRMAIQMGKPALIFMEPGATNRPCDADTEKSNCGASVVRSFEELEELLDQALASPDREPHQHQQTQHQQHSSSSSRSPPRVHKQCVSVSIQTDDLSEPVAQQQQLPATKPDVKLPKVASQESLGQDFIFVDDPSAM